MGQTARLLAHRHPLVAPHHLVMMADTDALLVDPAVLRPLQHSLFTVWVYWWEAVVDLHQSLPLSMLTMRASTWSSLLPGATTVHQLTLLPGAASRVFTREGQTTSTWEVDQSVTTTALLKAGLCPPPPSSPVWGRLGLVPSPDTTPSTCWRGQGWGECRARLLPHAPGMPGCSWWHGTMPASMLALLLPPSSPLYKLAEQHGLLVGEQGRLLGPPHGLSGRRGSIRNILQEVQG